MENIYEDSIIEQLIHQCTDPETGEFDEDKFNFLLADVETEAKIIDRAERIALSIQMSESIAADIKEKEEALAKRRKAKEHAIERARSYLCYLLESANLNKLETAMVKVSTRRTESVDIEDINKIPEQYMTAKTTYSADRKAIKDAIKSGAEVAGAKIVINTSATIK